MGVQVDNYLTGDEKKKKIIAKQNVAAFIV